MLTKYKNQIFQLLLNHPLGIDNFIIEDDENAFDIKYPTALVTFEYSFAGVPKSFDYFRLFATRFEPEFKIRPIDDLPTQFANALKHFESWLKNELGRYVEDQNEIDLWSQYKQREALSPIKKEDYLDLTTFTLIEKENIKLSLGELKQIIIDRFATQNTHNEIIEDRLNYLTESLDRTDNKTDWKAIFINTMISVSIALSLDAQKGQELYNLFMQVIRIIPAIGK